MKVISIYRKKFRELKQVVLSRNVTNTEAKILDFNYKNQEKILKSLFTLQGDSFANKLYTIEMLDSNKEYLPTSFLIPDYLCTVSGEVIGFTLPKFNGKNLSDVLLDNNVDYKEQIYYLKKIGELLNQLQSIRTYTDLKNIYINDLHEANFMVDPNNKELKVIDLDSCKIGHNKVFPSKYLMWKSLVDYSNKYKKTDDEKNLGHIIPDQNSDLYCYIITILNYLLKDNISKYKAECFYEYLNYLNNIGFDKELLDIFEKILCNCDNENPMNYLETITETQLCRARKNVFEQTKNKVLR